MSPNLSDDKKLHVLFRMEPGSMGPAGIDHIQDFCRYANDRVGALHSDVVVWQIVARMNKKLPEIHFQLAGKNITEAQAEKYLSLFGKELDDVQESLHDLLATLVDQFWEKDASRGR